MPAETGCIGFELAPAQTCQLLAVAPRAARVAVHSMCVRYARGPRASCNAFCVRALDRDRDLWDTWGVRAA